MAFELHPLAVPNGVTLRALRDRPVEGYTSFVALGEAIGRDPSNLRKSLAALAEAGIVAAKPLTEGLTEEGLAQLAALDRAADPDAASGAAVLPGELLLMHHQLEPDPDNPRTGIEAADAEDALDELRESIVTRMPNGEIRGLLQNLTVRPIPGDEGRFYVTGGNRRWHAVGQAIFDGDWEEDCPIRCRLRDEDPQASLETALIENKQRADMHPLDEAAAYARLRDEFGLSTTQISQRLSVQVKVIQNRLRLMDLDDDARARMRLPEDHEDRLTYKAALRSLQTPREPGSSPISAVSPPPVAAPAPFGERITDKEALVIVEVAAFIADNPDPDLPGYARLGVYQVTQGPAASLVAKAVLGFRYMGAKAWVTLRRNSTDAGAWLTGLGFDENRDDVLFEMRTRVHGAEKAAALAGSGEYATEWLKLASGPSSTVPSGDPFAPGVGSSILGNHLKSDEEFAAAETSLDAVLEKLADAARSEQPALIEESAEERAARQAYERERATAAKDRELAFRFADMMIEAMADARAGRKLFGDYFDAPRHNGSGSTGGAGLMVEAAFGALAIADAPLAGAALAHLLDRAGAMGMPSRLRELTLPAIENMLLSARVEQSRPMDDPESDPDPVEDFVQAELPEGEDEHEASEAPADEAAQRPVPAVPIRKSITPDFIVCLEDGRKFKSLKRHLRTRYDLTPEEYIARWGLPRDYPMVAPNYAKARADLARQMGLAE